MDYIAYLKSKELSLALFADGLPVEEADGHGVLPLLRLYSRGALKGRLLADKVVGFAAASLAAEGGVSELHAVTLSVPAAELLAARGIPFTCEVSVPAVLTADGTLCPMEKLTAGSADAAEAVGRLLGFFSELLG